MGRSKDKLTGLKQQIKNGSPGGNIDTVKVTGDEDKDTAALQAFGAVDAVLDITPSDTSMSTHTKNAIKALRRGGRVSLMGSTQNLGVPEILINITLKGKCAAVN